MGDRELQNLIQGLILLKALTTLNLQIIDSNMNEETIFSFLSLIIFTFPNLKECTFNIKGDQVR